MLETQLLYSTLTYMYLVLMHQNEAHMVNTQVPSYKLDISALK